VSFDNGIQNFVTDSIQEIYIFSIYEIYSIYEKYMKFKLYQLKRENMIIL